MDEDRLQKLIDILKEQIFTEENKSHPNEDKITEWESEIEKLEVTQFTKYLETWK